MLLQTVSAAMISTTMLSPLTNALGGELKPAHTTVDSRELSSTGRFLVLDLYSYNYSDTTTLMTVSSIGERQHGR